MNISISSNGMPIKRICLALAGVGFTALLAGCGGGSSSSVVTPPPPPVVTIDVFGARGTTLTAQVTSSNCSATPTVSWQTSGGVALGTGLSIQDTQPASAITATATCSTATATENLQALSVYNTLAAFAVMQNNSAEAWGNPVWGGQTAAGEALTNISQLFPSERGFAALLADSTVQTWGSGYVAVKDPNLTDPSKGAITTSALTNIASVIPGRVAYFGVKKDGSFVAWGNYRGLITQVDVAMNDATAGLSATTLASLTNVKSIASTEGAYAALKADGTVVSFGDPDSGGDSSSVKAQLTGVTQVVGTNYDFLALRKDGTVVGWTGQFGWAIPTSNQTLSNVNNLTVDGTVGVATTNSGTASAFGYTPDVDAADSTSVASLLTGVANIYATQTSFAALLSNGNVVSWGDLPRMQASLNTVQSSLTNVKNIVSSEYAFAALKGDGTVVTWGDPIVGGDSSKVSAQLTNVVALTSNKYAFAALKSNGTVVTWGMASKGGDSSAVASNLTNVRAIYATPFGAFLAVNKDGTFVNWGDQWAGGGKTPAKLTKIPFAS
ncbi:hypothetical protein H8K32_03230 [Undibacterium jejuense]|uniref:Uncharacterized protein n=1 Tax=Undibacterium jejuense TaxID=1344949 RepID=A0A923KNY5_9BURK|nr:hypothetical protein [Undibacterium jejuense]MBC3861101.1 hypothetical protein [Undibacterium jejuense]